MAIATATASLPLYVFCGSQLLAAKLRRSNIDASAGAVEEVARIIVQIRGAGRRSRFCCADPGFARDELMAWCEAHQVDYLFGLARNERLVGRIAKDLAVAEAESLARGAPVHRFADFAWRTLDSSSRERRVLAKAEHLLKGPNARFVVTSLPADAIDARVLYEDVYCARVPSVDPAFPIVRFPVSSGASTDRMPRFFNFSLRRGPYPVSGNLCTGSRRDPWLGLLKTTS